MKNQRSTFSLLLLCLLTTVSLLTACREYRPTKETVAYGYVRDSRGKPVEGVTIILSASKSKPFSTGSKMFNSVKSDTNGYYKISSPLDSEYIGAFLEIIIGSNTYSSATPYQKGPSGLVANASLVPEQVNEVDWVLTL